MGLIWPIGRKSPIPDLGGRTLKDKLICGYYAELMIGYGLGRGSHQVCAHTIFKEFQSLGMGDDARYVRNASAVGTKARSRYPYVEPTPFNREM